jgi:hypothetical protein
MGETLQFSKMTDMMPFPFSLPIKFFQEQLKCLSEEPISLQLSQYPSNFSKYLKF